MIEVELEIPIGLDSAVTPLLTALKNVHFIDTLNFGSDGFTFLCNATAEEWESVNKYLRSKGNHSNEIIVLSTKKDGTVVFLAKGKWTGSGLGGDVTHNVDIQFFKEWEKKSDIYSIGHPKVTVHSIKSVILAPEDRADELLRGLRFLKVNYKVLRMGAPRKRQGNPLSSLTERQRFVLRLAYEMGYYDIPRKTRTEELARKLGIDKGTFNDHLRRAEKHVIEDIFKEPY
jgi:DNA-binding CsgD family transcriptional regulator